MGKICIAITEREGGGEYDQRYIKDWSSRGEYGLSLESIRNQKKMNWN